MQQEELKYYKVETFISSIGYELQVLTCVQEKGDMKFMGFLQLRGTKVPFPIKANNIGEAFLKYEETGEQYHKKLMEHVEQQMLKEQNRIITPGELQNAANLSKQPTLAI